MAIAGKGSEKREGNAFCCCEGVGGLEGIWPTYRNGMEYSASHRLELAEIKKQSSLLVRVHRLFVHFLKRGMRDKSL